MYPDDYDELAIDTLDGFHALPRKTQVAYCVHCLEAEVNNGGFHQFIFNTSGLFVPQTMVALAEIGADKTLSLLKKALEIVYPAGLPDDPEQAEPAHTQSKEVHDALEPVDQQFYASEEPIMDLVNRYLGKQ